jgi:uncharacterized membrane protein
MTDLLWSPVLAPLLIGALALLVMAGTGWSLWRGVHDRSHALWLGVFRVAALGVLALLLFQPRVRREVVSRIAPQLAVVVDNSESMTDPVDDTQPRRADVAKQIVNSPALAKAREAFDVRMFSFDAKLAGPVEKMEPSFKGGGSNVISAVGQVQDYFRGQNIAAIVFISDGLDTSGASKSAALVQGVPVLTFELEKEWKPKEKKKRVSLGAVDYPSRVVVGWDSEVKAQIVGTNMSGATVTVEFWRDGKKQTEASVAFNEDEQTRPVAFPIAPEAPGVLQYELRVNDPAADTDAKKYPFVVEALAPGKRILYVQNSLGFDFKFLRKAIVTDRNLQLQAFVRWGDGKLVSLSERGVPAQNKLDLSQGGLARYSVVILGDLEPDALTPDNFRELKEFVNRGGALVLLGGGNLLGKPAVAGTALAEIAPVKLPAEYKEGQFSVAITETGLRHPVFGPLFANIKDFPSLLTANLTAVSNPTAEVLLETTAGGTKHPIIAASRFGKGKVVVVLSDTVYRWRLAAKFAQADKSPYDTFWTQLMDWLIPKEQDKQGGNKLELFTERPQYMLGEPVEVRAIVRQSDGGKQPASVALSVKTPDEKTFEYTMKPAMLPTTGGQQVPGFRAVVEPNVPGVFAAKAQVQAGAEKLEGESRFVVQKPATELTQKPIDRDLLKRIADESGGKFFPMGAHEQWLDAIHAKEQQFSRPTITDVWNNPLVLVVLLGLLAGDWVLRKKWNLP